MESLEEDRKSSSMISSVGLFQEFCIQVFRDFPDEAPKNGSGAPQEDP